MSAVSILPKGANFTRYAMALAATRGMVPDAVALASDRWGALSQPARFLRAAVAAGSTSPTAEWGDALVDYSVAAVEFWGLVGERSLLGRLSGFRKVPLNLRTVVASSGSSAHWVSERQPIPVSRLGFDDAPLSALKVAGLVVISVELAMSSNPKAEAVVRADLARAVQLLIDATFLSDDAAVADVSPAGVLFGVTATATTGTPADDVAALLADFEGDLAAAYFVGSAARLARLSSVTFPNVGARGGEIAGIPAVPSAAALGNLILIDPTAIALADGDLEISVSGEGSLQMRDDPVAGATTEVSLWQENLSGIRATKPINWRAARPAVSFIAAG